MYFLKTLETFIHFLYNPQNVHSCVQKLKTLDSYSSSSFSSSLRHRPAPCSLSPPPSTPPPLLAPCHRRPQHRPYRRSLLPVTVAVAAPCSLSPPLLLAALLCLAAFVLPVAATGHAPPLRRLLPRGRRLRSFLREVYGDKI